MKLFRIFKYRIIIILNLLIIALIIAIAIFSVSAFSNEKPKEHNYIDDPINKNLR
jgi:hypothetical protein